MSDPINKVLALSRPGDILETCSRTSNRAECLLTSSIQITNILSKYKHDYE